MQEYFLHHFKLSLFGGRGMLSHLDCCIIGNKNDIFLIQKRLVPNVTDNSEIKIWADLWVAYPEVKVAIFKQLINNDRL